MNKGIIIAAFAAIGKTTLAKKYSNVIDLESSQFAWDNKGFEHIPDEKRKAVKRKRNPEWPQNYFKAILEAQSKYDIVLTSMHSILLEYLLENNTEFYLAYPAEDSIDELVKRSYKRGNNVTFAEGLRKNIVDWQFRLKDKRIKKVIIIGKGEYLEDALQKENILVKK